MNKDLIKDVLVFWILISISLTFVIIAQTKLVNMQYELNDYLKIYGGTFVLAIVYGWCKR